MLVCAESVAESDHSSLVVEVPDVNLIFFDRGSATGFDDFGTVRCVPSQHWVAGSSPAGSVNQASRPQPPPAYQPTLSR